MIGRFCRIWNTSGTYEMSYVSLMTCSLTSISDACFPEISSTMLRRRRQPMAPLTAYNHLDKTWSSDALKIFRLLTYPNTTSTSVRGAKIQTKQLIHRIRKILSRTISLEYLCHLIGHIPEKVHHTFQALDLKGC